MAGGFVQDSAGSQGGRLDVLFRGGEIGQGHDVQGVHAPGYGAAVFDVALLEYDHLELGVQFQGPVGGHASGASSSDDQDVRLYVSLGTISHGFSAFGDRGVLSGIAARSDSSALTVDIYLLISPMAGISIMVLPWEAELASRFTLTTAYWDR